MSPKLSFFLLAWCVNEIFLYIMVSLFPRQSLRNRHRTCLIRSLPVSLRFGDVVRWEILLESLGNDFNYSVFVSYVLYIQLRGHKAIYTVKKL